MASPFVEKIIESALSANDGTREVTQSAVAVVKAGAALPISEAVSTLHGVSTAVAATRKALVFESDTAGNIIATRDVNLRDSVLERYTERTLDAIATVSENLAKLTA